MLTAHIDIASFVDVSKRLDGLEQFLKLRQECFVAMIGVMYKVAEDDKSHVFLQCLQIKIKFSNLFSCCIFVLFFLNFCYSCD